MRYVTTPPRRREKAVTSRSDQRPNSNHDLDYRIKIEPDDYMATRFSFNGTEPQGRRKEELNVRNRDSDGTISALPRPTLPLSWSTDSFAPF
ncbi:MAG: hypothetical protein ACJ72M_21865 [Propionibacteriaceae bacterium]|jgi:hypothetical protein